MVTSTVETDVGVESTVESSMIADVGVGCSAGVGAMM